MCWQVGTVSVGSQYFYQFEEKNQSKTLSFGKTIEFASKVLRNGLKCKFERIFLQLAKTKFVIVAVVHLAVAKKSSLLATNSQRGKICLLDSTMVSDCQYNESTNF